MTSPNTRCAGTPSRFPPKPPTQKWEILPCHLGGGARDLGAFNSRTVGVVVPNLCDPFFTTFAQAILDVGKKHGYFVLLTTSLEDLDMKHRQVSLLLRQQVDGLVIIPRFGTDLDYGGDAFSGIHLVSIEEPAVNSRFDSVLLPNRSGVKAGVEHLIGHGHRSIAFLGLNPRLNRMKARYEGYREAMLEAGYPPEPYIDCESPERTVALISSMTNSKNLPTAFFAANDLTILYVLHALSAMAIDVPRQIAVAGFDDFEMADVLPPSLTVIRQPVYHLGEVAANLLFQRISGSDVLREGHRVVLPFELIVRSSCGCQP